MKNKTPYKKDRKRKNMFVYICKYVTTQQQQVFFLLNLIEYKNHKKDKKQYLKKSKVRECVK